MKIQEIAVSNIKEDPEQPREQFGEEEITDLARFMAEVGDNDPIRVIALGGGKYQVFDGARRLLANQKNGTKKIKALVMTEKENTGLIGQLGTDAHKVRLSPAEVIRATARAADESPGDMHSICLATRRSSQTVQNDLKLAKLPVEMLTDLNEGTMDRESLLDMIERVDSDEWTACYKQMKAGTSSKGRKAKVTAYLKNKEENSVAGDEEDAKLVEARKISNQLFNKVTKFNSKVEKDFTLNQVFHAHKKDLSKVRDHVKSLKDTAKLMETGLAEFDAAQEGKPA